MKIILSNKLFIILLLTFSLTSCLAPRKISNQNFASAYQKEASFLHPQYEVYHNSESKSLLYFKINCKDLLYIKSPEKQNAEALVKISYQLFSYVEKKQIIDSSTVKVNDNEYNYDGGYLIGKIEFNAAYRNTYEMEITLTDLNRNQEVKSIINIDKSSLFTRQNYFITSINNQQPIFRNLLRENESVLLKYNKVVNKKELTVRYYNRSFPFPAPPFIVSNNKPFPYTADSIFTINLSDSSTAIVRFNKRGFYHIQADTTQKEGITLYRFAEDFPIINSTAKMVAPLRYLTISQEYNEILNSKNQKASLDDFWLKNAGNPDRARDVVKTYYNRVQNANEFFTSYDEGWKTDRGIIYIIYGPPNVAKKYGYSETWIYGEENSYKSINFNFVRVLNHFSNNDYVLIRSETYKDEYYKMADLLREGRIYNYTK